MDSKRILGGTIVAAAALMAATGVAGADSKKGMPIELTCGGVTYDVHVVPGNGHWTPAHDSGSNRVFHPTKFEDFTGTITDEQGNFVDTFTEEFTDQRGASHERLDTVDCTFMFVEHQDGLVFTGTGEVSGHFSGK